MTFYKKFKVTNIRKTKQNKTKKKKHHVQELINY